MKETICLVSLGCPKNLVDAEVILGLLARKGYLLTTDPKEAEILIVNTCSSSRRQQKRRSKRFFVSASIRRRKV